MKKILTVALLAFILVGCSGGSKEVTKVCSYEIEGTKTSMEMMSKDGKVVDEIVQTTSASLEDLGVTEEQFQAVIDQLKDQFNVEGVVYTTEIKDGVVTEKWVIDVKKAGNDQLVNMGMMQPSTGAIDINESVKQLEASGYTCK